MLLKSTPDSMTPLEFVEEMRDLSKNEAMREQIVRLLEYIARPKRMDDSIFVHAMGMHFFSCDLFHPSSLLPSLAVFFIYFINSGNL